MRAAGGDHRESVRKDAELERYRAIEAERAKWETERAMWEVRERRLLCPLESEERLGRRGDNGVATAAGGTSTESNAADTAGPSLGESGEGSTPFCVEGVTGSGFTHPPSTTAVTAPQVATAFVGQQLPPLAAFTGSRDGNREPINDWLER